MSYRKEQLHEGGEYHIYNRSFEGAGIFRTWEDYSRFTEKLLWLCRELEFQLYSWAVLPTHYHLHIKQNGNYSVSCLVHRLCTSYAMYFNRKYERSGHVFEKRFKVKVVDSEEYSQSLQRYINENAVHHGLCAAGEVWQFCSASTGDYDNLEIRYNDFGEFEAMEIGMEARPRG